MPSANRRVLVIGLDGMTMDVMKPLADEGVMPTCKALMDRGAWGTLQSTVPPVTGPAWTSFATGRQPGNHGVFDFFKPTRGSNRVGMTRRLINIRDVVGKTLWQIFTEHGKTSIVVNVPICYPPQPIRGAMITGMLTPSVDRDLTHPPDLYKRLLPELGEYVITINWQGYSEATAPQFVRDLIQCQRQRTKYTLRLMDDFPNWDFCFPCYTGTDRIQHALWHYIDPKEREKVRAAGRYDQKVMDLILEYYRHVDDDIAAITKKAGPDVPVFFVSDHGFGPLYGKFYVNNFLRQRGLLVCNQMRIRQALLLLFLKKVYGKFLKTVGLQRAWRKFVARRASDRTSATARTFYDIFYESIDWTRTKAYMASNTEGGLYINVKGRRLYGADVDHGCVEPSDYLKIRDEVIAALREIRHPKTGRPMLSHVEPRENVYHGKFLDRAPDIVFFLDGGEWLADFSLGRGVFRNADWKTGSGTHRMDGCFLAAGPGIKHRPGTDTSLIHVAPTILAAMDLPIPPDMDGKCIEEIFTDEWKSRHQIVYGGPSAADATSTGWGEGGGAGFDDQDEAVLIERLRGLGYID